jgi:hypothetical protein
VRGRANLVIALLEDDGGEGEEVRGVLSMRCEAQLLAGKAE